MTKAMLTRSDKFSTAALLLAWRAIEFKGHPSRRFEFDLKGRAATPRELRVKEAQRGMRRLEAAKYVGLSPSAFDKARRKQRYPQPTLPGGRFDRKLIDEAMNKLSGLSLEGKSSPLLEWRKRGNGTS